MATVAGVQDIDRGWEELQRTLRGLSEAYVSIGLHADAEGYPDGGPTVAEVASFHEFGQGVPQRAFFRPTIDGNRDQYAALCRQVLQQILGRRLRLRQGLTLIGLRVQADVRQAITELSSPPLSPETIKRKLKKSGLKGRKAAAYVGSGANPLIDTGHMRKSVTYQVHIQGEPGAGGPAQES